MQWRREKEALFFSFLELKIAEGNVVLIIDISKFGCGAKSFEVEKRMDERTNLSIIEFYTIWHCLTSPMNFLSHSFGSESTRMSAITICDTKS